MKNFLFIATLIFSSSLFSQENYNRKLTVEELSQDFEIFRNTLTSIHPDLYLYTSKPKFDSILLTVERKLDGVSTSIEFLRLLTPIIHEIRNSHTSIRPPQSYIEYIKTEAKRLPVDFIYRNDSLIVVKNYSPNSLLKSGDVVKKLNDVSSIQLMDSLSFYTFVDGYNEHYSNYLSSRFLSKRYAYFIGEPPLFNVEYMDSNGDLKKESIKSMPAKTFHSKMEIKPTDTKYDFKIKNNAGHLTITDFRIENTKKFKKSLEKNFNQMASKGIEHLVLDLRNNRGGFPENSDVLLSFFIKEKVYPIKKKFTMIEQLSDFKYILEDNAYGYFENSKKGTESNGVFVLEEAPKAFVKPNKKGFTGKLIVLINENSASATTSFLGQIRTHVPEALFIGNPTLGNPYIVSADYMVSLKLPNSNLIVKIPLVSSEKNVNFENPKGGVIPDIIVPITIEDVQLQTDHIMEKAIEFIRN